ncbi:transposase, partial [Streptococcus suis]
VFKTFLKYKTYITNAMELPYSNAKLEATNKLIKDIKRQAFGFILFKKQKLTYNRFMKLTIEQTKELKTYLKDKTYSPFHRRLQ